MFEAPPACTARLAQEGQNLRRFIVGVVFDGDVADFLEGHVAEDFSVFEDGFEGVCTERGAVWIGRIV